LLSGGVDSSLVAHLVKRQNPDARVVAFTLLLHDRAEEDLESARKVAEFLKLPHEVVDLRKTFKEKVVDYFVNSYARGLTPNPCAVCNRLVKLGEAVDRITSEGFEKVYTGHYARKGVLLGREVPMRGLDAKKDQSYFLALLRPEVLKKVEFPLGDWTKEEVRKAARELGLPTKDRGESQDVCFLGGERPREFLKRFLPPKAGYFLYKGKKVGTHGGIFGFTVGQRRGLGVRLGRPVYVKALDAEKNLVILGDREELYSDRLLLKEPNLFLEPEELKGLTLLGQPRYRTAPKRVKSLEFSPEGLKVVFEEPFFGVAPGQVGALYTPQGHLVAGGIIG